MIRAAWLGLALGAGLAWAAGAQEAENVLVLEVTGDAEGAVRIELLPEVAPQHVERIKALAREGAYDGVAFHRVIEGFMAQTGDVQYGTREAFGQGLAGTGGSDLPDLPAEFSDIPFDAGVVGMARSQDPDSANAQFFITLAPAPHLNGQYTVVGRVIEGQEVVNAIKTGAGPNGMVTDPDYIESARIESDG